MAPETPALALGVRQHLPDSPMKLAAGTTVITNGRLVDGNGGPPVADAAVVIRDGRVAYAGPVRGAPPVGPGAARLDARGGTGMPGLAAGPFHPTYFNVANPG